ncbi:MAG: ATP-binding cassette domain-containing protein, partial [Fimbriiglobus sp.]
IGYCLERCRITGVRRRLLSTLSKGYRQRVGLADALLAEPPVLILDEPLTGLDPVQQEETLNSIRELGGKHTVLFSSHHLPDVEKVCDRVIIIDRGRVYFDDKLSSIAERAGVAEVEVRGPQADILSAIQKLAWVFDAHEVGPGADGATVFEVRSADDRDHREDLARALVEKGYGVRRLGLRRARLEDVFMKVAFRRG